MSNAPKVRGDRQARAAAARKAAVAKERRRRLIATGIGAVVLVAVVAVLLVVGLSGKDNKSTGTLKSGGGNVPTWPAPTGADGLKAIHAAGLQAFGTEMLTYHIHAHLDVIDKGNPITVPPQIGFAYDSNGQPNSLSSLHTHQPDGIIHIEAPKQADYTLGQFFKEWQVPLSSRCVGTLCADAAHDLGFYVNGKQVTTDPNQIVLHRHDEIAVMYTTKGSAVKPPSSYDFPNGD